MNKPQQDAVELHKGEILDFLVPFARQLLPYLEEKNVIDGDTRSELEESKVYDRVMMQDTLNKLKEIVRGWAGLIDFIKKKGGDSHRLVSLLVAGSIQMAADLSELEKFTSAVANYYLKGFGFIRSHLGSRKHVNDIWVPPNIKDITEDVRGAQRQLDHFELQKSIKADSSYFAVIKGDPGMGKTILIQKICCDWAIQHVQTKGEIQAEGQEVQKGPFSLVLAVPLRSAAKIMFVDYVQLAIEYFHRLKPNLDKKNLIELANNLGDNLLIILDGLDEYAPKSFKESPLAVLFAPAHGELPPPPCSEQPGIPICKVIISSRPYALEQINPDFHPATYQLCLLDGIALEQFVDNYCKSEKGKEKVIECLCKRSVTRLSELACHEVEKVVRIPLILSFICYLADNDDAEIPSSLTLIYDAFLGHIITREKKGLERLTEPIELESWKTSKLAQATSQLAFRGCTYVDDNGEIATLLKFDEKIMKKCKITRQSRKDILNCGIILHRFIEVKDCHLYNFPHRSIQEFFAALYCYQLMLEGSSDERNSIVKNILNEDDSQLGRFLFGICSNEKKFGDMSDWLHISFADIQLLQNREVSGLIWTVEKSLIDCSKAEQRTMGERLLNSAEQIEAQLIAWWNQFWKFDLFLGNSCPDFYGGLNIRLKREGPDVEWPVNGYSRSVRLVNVTQEQLSTGNLRDEYDTIELLTCCPGNSFSFDRLSQPWLLPQIHFLDLRSCITTKYTDVVVSIQLDAGTSGKRSAAESSELRNFRFQYDAKDRLEYLTKLDQFETIIFKVTKTEVDQKHTTDYYPMDHIGFDKIVNFFNITVTVDKSVCQSILICSLIKLAFEVALTDTTDIAPASATALVSDTVIKLKRVAGRENPECYGFIITCLGKNKQHCSSYSLFNHFEVTESAYAIRNTLPHIRSSNMKLVAKKDLIDTLLRAIEVRFYIFDSHDCQDGESNSFIEIDKLANLLAEMHINSCQSLEAVEKIVTFFNLSRPDRTSKEREMFCDTYVRCDWKDYFTDQSRHDAEMSYEYNCVCLEKITLMLLNQIVIESKSDGQTTLGKMGVVEGIVAQIKRNSWMQPFESFEQQIGLIEIMMRLMACITELATARKYVTKIDFKVNLSANSSLRQKLRSYFDLFWHIWCQNLFEIEKSRKTAYKKEFESFLISFRCATILTNLIDPLINWPESLRSRTIDGVKIVPFQNISAWKLETETFLIHNTFRTDLRDLTKKSKEVQLVSLWTFANCSVTNADKYCPMLRDEGAVGMLTAISVNPNTAAEVRDLANLTVDNINKYAEACQENLLTLQRPQLLQTFSKSSTDQAEAPGGVEGENTELSSPNYCEANI